MRFKIKTAEDMEQIFKKYGQPDDLGHVTRYSDSSFYDSVCVLCGKTDSGVSLNSHCEGLIEVLNNVYKQHD